MNIFSRIFGTHSDREVKKIIPLVDEILAKEKEYSDLSESELKNKTQELKARLVQGESLDDILVDAFATVREAAWRVLGMKHYKVQLIGGVVLHQGRIAEMKTGEGKTLVATTAVYLNALSGKGVHVITVNDYLAKRDSEWMGKIYNYLGLSVGLVIHDKSNDERRKAYACDIVYGTNNEFGFDYLRDNMVTESSERVQRQLNYAIVDEVDSILIDEARTPLIISGQGDEPNPLYTEVDKFVSGLKAFVIAETDDKVEQEEYAGDADYIVDEKAKSAVLTQQGVQKAERYFKVDNLADEHNFDLNHFINNALKAHGTMQRDDQYVVQDGEIIIVDDFTGRLMYGRRYSDGLHQAIEAKEHVNVKRESKTLATITFQNYFRMYTKLSGMTGTALTEENEFRSIYSLDVVCIPTNKPIARIDENDSVYKTRRAKYKAIVGIVKEAVQKGQPVLIGTVSVEKSEELSKIFSKEGIKHEVLNAKQHRREAEIVAQAGRLGAITISTNMAGRGTDILLGGNPEFMAKQELRKQGFDDELVEQSTTHNDTDDELILDIRRRFNDLYVSYKKETDSEHEKVLATGGLLIIGTERHESRRIDNQLRGRAGRQGDPGRSKFYLSLEDDLLRLFGGDKMMKIFDMMNVDEDTNLEMNRLSKQIENAQKKVEGKNFGIRKHVLEYDDVMNKQRELIYAQRRRVLEGENVKPYYMNMISTVLNSIIDDFAHQNEDILDWNEKALALRLMEVFGNVPYFMEMVKTFRDKRHDIEELREKLDEAVKEYYNLRESYFQPEIMREIERMILLKAVDQKWMDHIDMMDALRNSIGMRGYAQKDPVIEYKKEGMEMFETMTFEIQKAALMIMMRAEIQESMINSMQAQAPDVTKLKEHKDSAVSAYNSDENGHSLKASADSDNSPLKRDEAKVGRNDDCPCGSGKKYKNCCGK